jgi:glycerophosphoryl diester phosphodiesterase
MDDRPIADDTDNLYSTASCVERRRVAMVSVLGVLLWIAAPAMATAQSDNSTGPTRRPPMQWIAHRGGVVDEHYQEHSLRSIEEAIRRGYWMLEADVRRTRDGHPIVHHDPTFARYYGDPRPVAELTWEEAGRLRSQRDGQPPLDFEQFAAACRGRTRLMLDVKVEDASESFYKTLEEALVRHALLDSAYLIGSDAAKKHFGERVKVSVNSGGLRDTIARQEDVSRRCFVFGIAAEIDEATVRLAQQHGVDVVPAVNTFRYRAANPMQRAARDVQRLRSLGVTRFQIDSVYEPLFLTTSDDTSVCSSGTIGPARGSLGRPIVAHGDSSGWDDTIAVDSMDQRTELLGLCKLAFVLRRGHAPRRLDLRAIPAQRAMAGSSSPGAAWDASTIERTQDTNNVTRDPLR